MPSHRATANCRYRRPPLRSVAIVSVVIGIAISLLDLPAAAEDASKPSAPAAASSHILQDRVGSDAISLPH